MKENQNIDREFNKIAQLILVLYLAYIVVS